MRNTNTISSPPYKAYVLFLLTLCQGHPNWLFVLHGLLQIKVLYNIFNDAHVLGSWFIRPKNKWLLKTYMMGVFAGKVQVAMINQYMGVAPSTFQMVYLRFDWVYPLLKGFLKNLNS